MGDFTFVGGWISPGEKAVRDLLLREPQGQIVEILPSAMPHDYKVGSLWLPAIREKRAAIIARGNSEIEFSRAACLEVNEAACKIATAGIAGIAGLEPGSQDGGAGGALGGGARLESRALHGGGAAGVPGGGALGGGAAGVPGGGALGGGAAGVPGGGASGGGALGGGARLESRALHGGGMAIYWLPDGPHVISRSGL